MPTFEIEAKGKTFEIEAPSQREAILGLDKFVSQPQQPTEQPKDNRGIIDKLLGQGGPRYQTFPERIVRDIAGIPEKAITAARSSPLGSREATEATVGPSAEAALAFSPMSRAAPLFKAPKVITAAVPGKSPTEEELFKSATANYKGARFLDLQVQPQESQLLAADIGQQLIKPAEITDKAFFPEDAPVVHKLVERLGVQHQGQNTTIADIESVRSALGNIVGDPLRVGSERGAAFRAIEMLDKWVDELKPGNVVSGDPEATLGLLKKARGDWAAMKRSQRLTEAEHFAELETSSTGKSANLVNKLKQGVKSVLKSPKKRRGYSPEEIAAMEQLVRTTNPQQLLRIIASFGPTHPITGWGPAIGAFFAGDLGLAAGGLAIGHAAQKGGEALARRKMRQLGELVRSNSPLGKSMAGKPAVVEPQAYNAMDPLTGGAIRELIMNLGPGFDNR